MNADPEIGRQIRHLMDAAAPPVTAGEAQTRPHELAPSLVPVGRPSKHVVRRVLAAAAVVLVLGGGWYVVERSPGSGTVSATGGPTTPSAAGQGSSAPPGTAGLRVPTAPFPRSAAAWDAYATAHHPDDTSIDFERYRTAVDTTVECMRAQGVPVTGPIASPAGRFVWYTYAGTDVDGIATSCRALAETDATKRWTAKSLLERSEYLELASQVATCEAHATGNPQDAPTEVVLACTARGERDALSGSAP